MNAEIKNLADVLSMWTVMYHQASSKLEAARDAFQLGDGVADIRKLEEQREYCWNQMFFYQECFNSACRSHALATV